MKRVLTILAPCLIVSTVFFVLLWCPVLTSEVEKKLPLLSMYYISRQLETEINDSSLQTDVSLARLSAILKDYDNVVATEDSVNLASLSASGRVKSLSEELLSRFVLWLSDLPQDFLVADPIGEIRAKLEWLTEAQRSAAVAADEMMNNHVLECLRYELPSSPRGVRIRPGMPPEILEKGLFFCGERIPFERPDIRRRIEHQVDYLASEFRETTVRWLKGKDRYGEAIGSVLDTEGMPHEFCLLPAIESGYRRMVVSPALARGWWQFSKPTAVKSLSGEKHLDWTLMVASWRDERKDLVASTRAAARYLKWIRSRFTDKGVEGSWIIAAAAYNAGVAETNFRSKAYDTSCFWDMKLPLETEEYVPRWVALFIIDTHRSFYGIEIPAITPLEFESIEGIILNRDLPLSVLATLSECSVRFVREINGTLKGGDSSFRARRSNADITYTIHIPRGFKESVMQELVARGYVKNGS